jgi:hypothetical protein
MRLAVMLKNAHNFYASAEFEPKSKLIEIINSMPLTIKARAA